MPIPHGHSANRIPKFTIARRTLISLVLVVIDASTILTASSLEPRENGTGERAAVMVTPKGGARVRARPRGRHNAVVFRVQNTGTSAAVYAVTCAVTNPIAACRVISDSLRVEPGASMPVPVIYSTTPTTGAARVSLTATELLNNSGGPAVSAHEGVSDTGYYDVEVAGAAELPGDSISGVAVFVEPASGSFFSPTLDMVVEWCSWGAPLNAASRVIKFNGMGVTATFDYTTAAGECAYTAYSNGSVTLQPGENVVSASISNTAGNFGSGASYDTLAAPPGPSGPIVNAGVNPNSLIERSACVTSGAGQEGAFQCGSLLVAHSMPGYTTLGRSRELTLLYNSATARPYAIVMADVSIPGGQTLPDRLDVSLTVNGVQRASASFSTTGFVAGGSARRLAIGFNPTAVGLVTGVHSYTLTVANVYGAQSYPSHASGDLILIDRRSTPYGAGWNVAGVERIFHGPRAGAKVIIGGDGSAAVYDSIGIQAWRAPIGAYRDTLFYGAVSDGSVPAATYYWRRGLDETRIFYDTIGRQRYVVDRFGNKAEYTYVTADPSSALQYIRIAPWELNKKYTFAYSPTFYTVSDPAGRIMKDSLNAAGRLARIADPGIGGVTVLTYDSYNRLTRWRSRRSFSTAYAYYTSSYLGPTGLLLKDSLPVGTNAKGYFTPVQLQGLAASATANATVRSDSAFLVIDGPRADGDTARFLVNSNLAPTTIIDPLKIRTVLSYDPANPLLPASITRFGAATVTHQMIYDVLGRLVESTDVTHSGGPAITKYRYENPAARDRPTHVTAKRTPTESDSTVFVYDNTTGLLSTATDPRGYTTSFQYTARGQVQSVTNPLSQTTRFTYSTDQSNLETVRTHLDHTTTYEHDAYGNVFVVSPPVGARDSVFHSPKLNLVDSTVTNDVRWGRIRTKYLYDEDGNRTRVTDPRDIARSFAYDELGRQTQMTDELLKIEKRTYTPDGLLLSVFRRDSSEVKMYYDVMGRDTLTSLTPSPAYGGAADTIKKQYDTNSNLTRVDNTNSTVTRTYAPEAAITSETQALKFASANNATFIYEYWYNLAGARDSMRISGSKVPTAKMIRYVRGPDNLLEQLKWDSKTATLGYDALARRKTIAFPSSTTSTFTYDADGRLSGVTVPGSTYAFSNIDALGRPADMAKTGVENLTYHWEYDDVGQLLSVDIVGGPPELTHQGYEYDKAGNRARQTGTGDDFLYTYWPGTNRLRKRCAATATWICISGAEFQENTYNSNGDVVRQDKQSGLYVTFYRDAAGQLTTYYADSVQWRYDGLGRMVMRRDGTRMNILTGYDGVNTAWYDGVLFLHGDGTDDPLVTLLGVPCYFVTKEARLYAYMVEGGVDGTCANNWLSHGRNAGAIADSYTFGLSRSAETTSTFSYFRNRWYDAASGRFTQEDPIGFAGRSNLYAYAGNNPAVYTDPFGLCPDCILDAVAIGADLHDIRKRGWSRGRGLTLGADVLAAGLPFIPAIAGATARGLGVGTRLVQGNARSGLEHIVLRHWHSSGFSGTSKFGANVGLRELRNMVEGATGRWRTEGASRVLDTNVGKVIGTDAAGDASTWLRIVTNKSGDVITAYPIRNP
jgi:RHS repeat-associated protein